MKIPKGTEADYYWIKFDDKWFPAFVREEVVWKISVPQLPEPLFAVECDELGPRIRPPDKQPKYIAGDWNDPEVFREVAEATVWRKMSDGSSTLVWKDSLTPEELAELEEDSR